MFPWTMQVDKFIWDSLSARTFFRYFSPPHQKANHFLLVKYVLKVTWAREASEKTKDTPVWAVWRVPPASSPAPSPGVSEPETKALWPHRNLRYRFSSFLTNRWLLLSHSNFNHDNRVNLGNLHAANNCLHLDCLLSKRVRQYQRLINHQITYEQQTVWDFCFLSRYWAGSLLQSPAQTQTEEKETFNRENPSKSTHRGFQTGRTNRCKAILQ